MTSPVNIPAATPVPAARPYGIEGVGQARLVRGPNLVFIGGAALLIVGFILPWLSIGPLSFGGAQIPFEMSRYFDMAEASLESNQHMAEEDVKAFRAARTAFKSLYAIYLIPVLCIVALLDEFVSMKRGRNRWWLRAFAAASPLISFVLVIIVFAIVAEQMGTSRSVSGQETRGSSADVFKFIGIGIWLAAAGFIVSVAGVFTSPRPRAAPGEFRFRRRASPKAPVTAPGAARPPAVKLHLSRIKLPGPRGPA